MINLYWDLMGYSFVYVIFWIIGMMMIVYSIKMHFDTYDAQYVPVKAEIVNVYCDRYIVNRRRDDYHCVLTLKYEMNEKIITSSVQTVDNVNQYVGTQVMIYVDKENPINIYIPNISLEYLTTMLFFIGLVILIMTTGAKIINV
jgi:hypothetical protein